ncbi:MAG TPA: hypothetical protein VM597_38235 [Gemmataceae bacterium]|jgi:hypothetical protein|nr:hypothetical protein [Gemmataceae bacterium]
MKRVLSFLALSIFAVGCGGSKSDGPAAAGRPPADEARTCIAAYLAERGLVDVEFVSLRDEADLPSESKVRGEAWAFAFSATYKNIFGETQKGENWVAVVTRSDGKTCVAGCFDEARKPLGGRGQEEAELPPIVAPAN